MHVRAFSLFLILCSLAGCEAIQSGYQSSMDYLGLNKSPPPQPQAVEELKGDHAVLYIYRPSNVIFMPRTAVVNLDDAKLIELNGDVYTFAYLKPGTYKISQYWTTLLTQQGSQPDELQEVTVNLKSGQKAFVEIGTRVRSDGQQVQTAWDLKAVDEQTALARLQRYKYKGNPITTVEPERAAVVKANAAAAGPSGVDSRYNHRFERD